MLTILDVMLVAHFGFSAHIPWWLWAWGIFNELGMGDFQRRIYKVCKQLLDSQEKKVGQA